MEADQLMRSGRDSSTARRRALLRFGGVQRYKEGVRAARWTHVLYDFANDHCYAWRGLRRSPGLAVVAAVKLALGVGATTAIFSVTNSILFRKPDINAPDRVAVV